MADNFTHKITVEGKDFTAYVNAEEIDVDKLAMRIDRAHGGPVRQRPRVIVEELGK